MTEFDGIKFNQPEDELDFSNMSIDELLASTKEDLARTERMMQPEPMDEPQPEQEDIPGSMPLFEPTLPDEYADLTLEDASDPEEVSPQKSRWLRLPAGIRVLLYVCCVLAASISLAAAAWLCADDVLALTKPDRLVSVTVSEGDSITDVTQMLHDQDLIEYPWLFKFYCWLSHAEQKIEPGTYTINNLYDYHALINAMRGNSGERATVTVVITEGYECADIFKELQENGVCTVDQLEKVAAEHPFEYDFLNGLEYGNKNRLEGYLFPDTYEFFVGDNAVNVIDKFLRNYDRKLTEELRAAVDDLNVLIAAGMTEGGFTEQEIANSKLTLHDVIIVASLIEKETAKTSESATIASVIYNRLCSKLYPCLQIDATIQYVLPERKEVLSNVDKAFISPYNTYTNAGLPEGPIANPGINSIRAALYPADTEYYFYALNKDGVHSFSETYYEHQEVLAQTERN